MFALIYFALIGCAFSTPQWYNSQVHGGGGSGGRGGGGEENYGEKVFGGGGGRGGTAGGYSTFPRPGGHTTTRRPGGYTPPGGPGKNCPPGQVPHAGSCVAPEVKQWLFVYGPPKTTTTVGPLPYIPKPKINYNLVLVHSPEQPKGQEPIVVPQPQQKTIVYVLTKNGEEGQQIIEVPAGPKDPPKVFYVNYNEGENPSLPGGITLEEALNTAITQESKTIDGDGNGNGNGNSNGNGNGSGNRYENEGGSGGNQNQKYH